MEGTPVQGILDTLMGLDYQNVLIALAILVAGWLVGKLVASIVTRMLGRTDVDDRLVGMMGGHLDPKRTERTLGTVVYYLVLLFAVVAALQRLGLDAAATPIQGLLASVMNYLPRIGAAALTILVAYVVARIAREMISRGADLIELDSRVNDALGSEGEDRVSLSRALSSLAYGLILLFFLPGVLGTLGLRDIAEPLSGMVDNVMAMLPNVLGAVIVIAIGMYVARFVRDVVANVLSGVGLDELAKRAGVDTGSSISGMLASVAYALVAIPTIVAGLHQLKIEAISAPAVSMLESAMAAIPNIFAAALVLGLAYVAGKVVAGLLSTILEGVGFDRVPEKLGMSAMAGSNAPSKMAGKVALAYVLLFAASEAASMLGFESLSGSVDSIVALGGNILLGLVVFGLGLYVANIAASAIMSAQGESGKATAALARAVILVLVGAMALQQAGIGSAIVESAFQNLGLGLAVAAAIAFGWGGREIAENQLKRWFGS